MWQTDSTQSHRDPQYLYNNKVFLFIEHLWSKIIAESNDSNLYNNNNLSNHNFKLKRINIECINREYHILVSCTCQPAIWSFVAPQIIIIVLTATCIILQRQLEWENMLFVFFLFFDWSLYANYEMVCNKNKLTKIFKHCTFRSSTPIVEYQSTINKIIFKPSFCY